MSAPAINTTDRDALVGSRQFAIRLKWPMWIGLATVLLSLAAAGEDDQVDDVSEQSILPARQQMEISWLKSWAANDAVAASRQFELIQRERISLVDRVCGLTVIQKERLQLAARGDKKRIIDRAEEIGTQLQLAEDDPEKVSALFQKVQMTRRGSVRPGPSFAGSYFAKYLEQLLTAMQAAQYAPLRPVLRAGGLVHMQKRGTDDVVEIDLSGTAFADDDLAQLSAWPEVPALCTLSLTGTKITDAGLEHLKKLSHIRELDLSYTQISDAGLDDLKALTSLRHLTLRGLNECLSDEAAADLKHALPMLEIHW